MLGPHLSRPRAAHCSCVNRISADIRLRRAIHRRSTSLVKRIILANPLLISLVCNPDSDAKGETSLHLAASLGLPEIAKFLIENGHEDGGISRTYDGVTPLMLAAQAGDEESNAVTMGRLAVGRMLIEAFPEQTAIKDKEGMDAFAHAAKYGTVPLLTMFLSLPPPASLLVDPDIPPPPKSPHVFLHTRDEHANTPLHHASAFGQLKTLRLLVSAGADPSAKNQYMWTPLDYSASVAAEVYFRGLIREIAQRQQLEVGVARGNVNVTRTRGGSEVQRTAHPGVRLVHSEGGSVTSEESEDSIHRMRARAGTGS